MSKMITKHEPELFTADCEGTPVRLLSEGPLWFALSDIYSATGRYLPEGGESGVLRYVEDRARRDGLKHEVLRSIPSPDLRHRFVTSGAWKPLYLVTPSGVGYAFEHLFPEDVYGGWPDLALRVIEFVEEQEILIASGPWADEPLPYGYITPEWPQGYGVPAPRLPPPPAYVAAPCESVAEQAFWDAHLELQAPHLAGLVTQHWVCNYAYRLDFALPHLKIGIEIDGWEYHGQDRDKFSRDRKRWREIEQDGWRLVRFSGREIRRDVWGCINDANAYVRQFAKAPPA